MNGSRPLSSPPPNWPSMRRRCQCSIPGAARPRPATSGRSRVMTGPGAFRSARRARFASDTTDARTDAVGTSDASTCWHRLSADDRTARRGERHSYLRRSLRGPKLLDASPIWGGGRSKSSPGPRASELSSQSPGAGLPNAPSLGSDATVALLKTSRRPSPAPRPGS